MREPDGEGCEDAAHGRIEVDRHGDLGWFIPHRVEGGFTRACDFVEMPE